MSKKVLVPIADGSEEIEFATIVDVLRRADAEVTVASVAKTLVVTCAHQVKITADSLIGDCVNEEYDLIALPGGMPGAENLRDSPELTELLKNQIKANRLHAAICASPAVVLAHHGLLEEKTATAYPGFEAALPNKADPKLPVVVHDQCITSKSPGTAMIFALTLVNELFGAEKAAEIKSGLALA